MTNETRHGNMLESVESGVILHQVNAQGVMGGGIALLIRRRWPVVWDDYRFAVPAHLSEEESRARLGTVIWSEVGFDFDVGPLLVASIVGQQFYGAQEPLNARRYTSYDAIDIALTKLANDIRGVPGAVVHYPLLGCGLGGGNWSTVKSIINHRLSGIEHHLWLLPGVVEPS